MILFTCPIEFMSSHITPEQYLELDRKAEFKSEYYLGELTPVAGPGWVDIWVGPTRAVSVLVCARCRADDPERRTLAAIMEQRYQR